MACYVGLTVDTETFPDHACLLASFALGREFACRFLWPTPDAIPWNLVGLPRPTVDFSVVDPTWRLVEKS